MKFRFLTGVFALCLGFSFASLAQAGDYTVQIGAFRNAPAGFSSAAERVGPLRTTLTANGVTRYRIGDFASRDAADAARDALVEAGYPDAFVIRSRGAAEMTAVRSPTAPAMRDADVGDPLANLPAHLQSRVVLLDGEYHVKDGDRFIKLDEALRNEGAR